MLRLIGLVVVILFVLSLAHGERTGSPINRANARAETLVDGLTGALADGVQALGDAVFGPAGPSTERPRDLRDLARTFDGLARSTDAVSRRTLAQVVLRACPSLGLVCQPATDPPGPGARRDPLQPAP